MEIQYEDDWVTSAFLKMTFFSSTETTFILPRCVISITQKAEAAFPPFIYVSPPCFSSLCLSTPRL